MSARWEFLPIESRPFLTCDLDLTDPAAYEELFELGPPIGRTDGAIVKLRYTATREQARRIDNAAIRQALLRSGAHRVYIEPTIEREQRSRVEGLDENVTDTDALDLWIGAQEIDEARATALRAQHTTYTEAMA